MVSKETKEGTNELLNWVYELLGGRKQDEKAVLNFLLCMKVLLQPLKNGALKNYLATMRYAVVWGINTTLRSWTNLQNITLYNSTW